MKHLEGYIEGYTDALKDTGEWFEMTEREQKDTVKKALIYFEKIDYAYENLKVALLNHYCPQLLQETYEKGEWKNGK